MRTVLRIAIACATLLLLPAAAQAGVSPDQLRISGDTDIDVFPVTATSPAGESIVVWTERGGATSILRFRRVHPDGSTGPATTISDATMLPVQRVVSVAPDGRALVAWSESTNGTAPLFLRGRWIEADGSMGPQLTLREAVAATSSAGSPAVAATTDGDAVVAWRNTLSTPTGRVEALRVDATGTLGTLLQPTQGPGSSTVDVAPALGGAALLAWTGDPASIWTMPVTAAGAAGAVQNPVVGDVIATPRLSTNGFDDFHLLFAPINIPTDQVTTLAIGPTGVATGTRRTLESGATQAGFPQLATDVTGRSLALWTRDGTIAAGRFIGADGVPDAATLTAPAEQQSGQAVAMLGDGSGLLLWGQGPSGGPRALWSRLVGPGAAAAAPVQLATGDGSTSRVSVSPAGIGLIAWQQRDGGLTGPIRVAARQILPPPVCADAAATVVQGRPTRVPLSCTGLQLTGREVLTKTAHGTLGAVDAATASVLYTPVPGFQGSDAFTFRGTGKGGPGATQTARIAVGRDTTAPVVGAFNIKTPRVRLRTAFRKPAARRPAFSVRLSEPATVAITIERRVGRRFRPFGTLRAKVAGTTATIPIRKKVGRRRLVPGVYRARIVATDLALNRSAPTLVRFTVTRR